VQTLMATVLFHLEDVLVRHLGRALAAIGGLACGVGVAVYLTSLLSSVVSHVWSVDAETRSVALIRATGDIADGGNRQFDEADLRRLRAQLPDAESVRPVYSRQTVATVCGSERFVVIVAIDPGIERLMGWQVTRGRSLGWSDTVGTTNTLVASTAVGDDLDCHIAEGATLAIGVRRFTVVGVARPGAQDPSVGEVNSLVFITPALFEKIYGRYTIGDFPVIAVTFRERILASRYEALIQAVLARGGTSSRGRRITVDSSERVDSAAMQLTHAGGVVLVALVGLSVVIAAVGIATTVLMGAIERQGEIGLKRCVGAQRDEVATEFFAETVTLAVGGCVLGLGAGLLLLCLTCQALGMKPRVDIRSAGAVIALSIGCAALAGLAPALWAARLDPVKALEGK
jgi:putative ABC transport system permease protein